MDTHVSDAAVLAPPGGLAREPLDTRRPGVAGAGAGTVGTILPVVLCGGSGTRLWPLSREARPKQFLPLVSQRTLLQETLARATGRLADGTAFTAPMVVCNREHRFEVAGQALATHGTGLRLVLEPVGRNSAPAVAVAALLAAGQDPDAVMWVMPADAMIADTEALHAALEVAVAAARLGAIVTFGMRPDSPETGYGYIEPGARLAGVEGAFEVARFVEKPDLAGAEAMLAGGRHLWNAGIFVATAASFLREFRLHAPAVLDAAQAALAASIRDGDCLDLDEATFANCPAISLDHAVAERTRRAAVVPASFAWSDLGSWAAIWQAAEQDANGNAVRGDVLVVDSQRCLVRAEAGLAAVVGLSDVMLVVTDDAVLAVHRERAQEVKHVVDALRRRGRSEARSHRRVHRPWGHYESLALEERCQVKRIVVEIGQRLSLQRHYHRAEHWVVVKGAALVTRDAEQIQVSENECIYLPLGCVHRLENLGRIPLVLIEVQVGSYLGEDDIVRIEDQYGRAPA